MNSQAITRLLGQWHHGDEEALRAVIEMIYHELRFMARRYLYGEVFARDLQSTALIHEMYLRLSKNQKMRFENRAQFFWFAGQLMRQIMVDEARARLALKRGGSMDPVPLEKVQDALDSQSIDIHSLISLDQALCRLAEMDPRLATIVELRFFMGMNLLEVARALELSETTIKREWNTAKRWLARELQV